MFPLFRSSFGAAEPVLRAYKRQSMESGISLSYFLSEGIFRALRATKMRTGVFLRRFRLYRRFFRIFADRVFRISSEKAFSGKTFKKAETPPCLRSFCFFFGKRPFFCTVCSDSLLFPFLFPCFFYFPVPLLSVLCCLFFACFFYDGRLISCFRMGASHHFAGGRIG